LQDGRGIRSALNRRRQFRQNPLSARRWNRRALRKQAFNLVIQRAGLLPEALHEAARPRDPANDRVTAALCASGRGQLPRQVVNTLADFLRLSIKAAGDHARASRSVTDDSLGKSARVARRSLPKRRSRASLGEVVNRALHCLTATLAATGNPSDSLGAKRRQRSRSERTSKTGHSLRPCPAALLPRDFRRSRARCRAGQL
jgi:hypothetical protein